MFVLRNHGIPKYRLWAKFKGLEMQRQVGHMTATLMMGWYAFYVSCDCHCSRDHRLYLNVKSGGLTWSKKRDVKYAKQFFCVHHTVYRELKYRGKGTYITFNFVFTLHASDYKPVPFLHEVGWSDRTNLCKMLYNGPTAVIGRIYFITEKKYVTLVSHCSLGVGYRKWCA